MAKEDLVPYEKNVRLKNQFKALRLDLREVMEFTPLDLDLENRRLESLLAFVRQFEECGRSRKSMEVIGRPFPPIFPMISPDSDWHRFRRWLDGQPLRLPLKEQLKEADFRTDLGAMTDEEVETELHRLAQQLGDAGFCLSEANELPPRLLYAYLLETLEEEFECDDGGWVLDGCDGYCPGCFQRPWCNVGTTCCWPEDEAAGTMHLTEEAKQFVSPSPYALDILRAHQREEDERMEAYLKERDPDPEMN